MAQNVILHICDLERSRSNTRVNKILHCNAHTTHEYTCEVSLKSYGQLFRYGEQIVARRKKERKKERRRIKRNSLTGVDTL